MKFPHFLITAGALALLTSIGSGAEVDFYVGTYTWLFGSRGIYHYQFDDVRGEIRGGELAVKSIDPSFLVIHPNRKWIYAANEGKYGEVSAYAIAPGGQLQLLNVKTSRGDSPCHVSLDPRGRHLLVANYSSGTVAVYAVEPTGALGALTGFDQQHGSSVNRDRQKGPYAHSIYVEPANRFAYSCDLGNDKVEGYRYDPARGSIAPDKAITTRIAPGSGPRHLVLDPRGFVYVINEMGSTVTILRRDTATGAMRTLQTISTLPAGYTAENTTAEIALHPNGKFLYASNRGHDSIVVFAVGHDGRLSFVDRTPTGGKVPRNFSFDPSGRWLLAANQKTNDIFVFRVSGQTGKLTATGRKVQVGAPVCVAFMPPKWR